MARNVLILGASYGSLLATKLLMAGHNVTLVCRRNTAELINRDGTEVRIKLRDEAMHRAIFSRDLPGKLDAVTPDAVDLSRYDPDEPFQHVEGNAMRSLIESITTRSPSRLRSRGSVRLANSM